MAPKAAGGQSACGRVWSPSLAVTAPTDTDPHTCTAPLTAGLHPIKSVINKAWELTWVCVSATYVRLIKDTHTHAGWG